MNKTEKAYLDAVASLGCIACREAGHNTPAVIHHIRAGQGMAQRAGNALVIPLCPEHHNQGGHGIAIHAGQRTWEQMYGTELELLNKTILDVFKKINEA
jgi:hypothetical protein